MSELVTTGLSAKAVGVIEAAAAREELYGTLGQLRDRLNYAQRVDDAVDDAKARIIEIRRKKPLVFVAGCLGVATASGVAVWGIVRGVTRYIR